MDSNGSNGNGTNKWLRGILVAVALFMANLLRAELVQINERLLTLERADHTHAPARSPASAPRY